MLGTVAVILAIAALACVPGLWAIYLVLIRRAPRPWAVRLALALVFLMGVTLGLNGIPGPESYPPEIIMRVLATPVLFAFGPLQAFQLGAFASYAIGAGVLLAWVILCTRLSRPLAFAVALILGAVTTNVALPVEDRVQAYRITQAAERLGATCLQLRHSFSDTLDLHWNELLNDYYYNRPPHARATIDGVDMIWSYRLGQFFEPRRTIVCETE